MLGSYFFANMGGGGGQNCSHGFPFRAGRLHVPWGPPLSIICPLLFTRCRAHLLQHSLPTKVSFFLLLARRAFFEARPGVSKESEKSLKSGFGLYSDSFETPGRTLWALLGPCPRVLFPDSFRTLRARETLCGAGPMATSESM